MDKAALWNRVVGIMMTRKEERERRRRDKVLGKTQVRPHG
jgi:hypothetical protein